MKHILATAAVALLMSGPAFADTAANVEKDGYAPIEFSMVEADSLEGASVYTADDTNIGEISQLLIDANGKTERAVIDVGGFLGLGEKPVAVPFEVLTILKQSDGDDVRVYIGATQEELDAMPKYEG